MSLTFLAWALLLLTVNADRKCDSTCPAKLIMVPNFSYGTEIIEKVQETFRQFTCPLEMVTIQHFNNRLIAAKVRNVRGLNAISQIIDHRTRIRPCIATKRDQIFPHNINDTHKYVLHNCANQENGIVYLDMSQIGFTTLNPNILSRLSDCLQFVYLTNNKLMQIPIDIFNGLPNLGYIDLSFNQATEISYNFLNGAHAVILVNMSHNYIKSIGRHLFNKVNIIETLDFSFNNITEIPVDTFNELKSLKHLKLSHNQLRSFSYFPSSLENLESLELAGNALVSLSIHGLGNLKFVNLSRNMFHVLEMKWLDGLPNLDHLDVSHNEISRINCESSEYRESTYIGDSVSPKAYSLNNCKRLRKLSYLDLSYNKFKLKSDTLGFFETLRVLNLEHNHLINIPVHSFYGLVNLTKLMLGQNKIRTFNFGSFTGLHRLSDLDISYNKLTYIPENQLMVLSGLKTLNLSGNNIVLVNIETLLQKLPKLEVLNIANMGWGCDQLANTLASIRKSGVQVPEVDGFNPNEQHIGGIPCHYESSTDADTTHFSTEAVVTITTSFSPQDHPLIFVRESDYGRKRNYSDNRSPRVPMDYEIETRPTFRNPETLAPIAYDDVSNEFNVGMTARGGKIGSITSASTVTSAQDDVFQLNNETKDTTKELSEISRKKNNSEI